MKPTPTFQFIDEPQFKAGMSRAEAANRLRSYRNTENGNKERYIVSKVDKGYTVQLNYTGSPVALITTK